MKALFILLPWALAIGCRSAPQEESAPFDVPVAAASALPVDHLAPGELLAGTDKAFALVLPRGFTIRAAFTGSVLADGPATAVDLARYVAARVSDGQAKVQPQQATFDGVRDRDEPARVLRIRIEETAPGYCQLQINDDTPHPDLGGDVAERLKRIGRTPDGKLEGRDKME